MQISFLSISILFFEVVLPVEFLHDKFRRVLELILRLLTYVLVSEPVRNFLFTIKPINNNCLVPSSFEEKRCLAN